MNKETLAFRTRRRYPTETTDHPRREPRSINFEAGGSQQRQTRVASWRTIYSNSRPGHRRISHNRYNFPLPSCEIERGEKDRAVESRATSSSRTATIKPSSARFALICQRRQTHTQNTLLSRSLASQPGGVGTGSCTKRRNDEGCRRRTGAFVEIRLSRSSVAELYSGLERRRNNAQNRRSDRAWISSLLKLTWNGAWRARLGCMFGCSSKHSSRTIDQSTKCIDTNITTAKNRSSFETLYHHRSKASRLRGPVSVARTGCSGGCRLGS